MLEAKDQGHKRKCSPKKKKKVFTKIFQAISTKKRFLKNFSSAPQNFNNSKNTAVLEPRTGQFSRTWGLEAKDFKMCPRGRPRGQGRPRGLHLCPSMGYIIALPFSLLLNCCPTAGIFPSKLKLAKVVPVFKKGPTDLLTNYRSISLLPSLSKVFERIICNRLLFFFTSMNTTVSIRRIARYSQWGGCFWGLGANG